VKTSLNWFMPALAKRRVGSPAGMSEDEGTRRCPRFSKYSRNRSRISADVIMISCFSRSPGRGLPLPFHLRRNRRARETPPYQRVPDPPTPFLGGEPGARLLKPCKQERQGFFFRAAVELRESSRRGLPGKPARRELAGNADPAVSAGPGTHERPRRRGV